MKIFFDGQCPLCVSEMNSLRKFDKHNKIQLIDVHEERFSSRYPHVNKQNALSILHGETDSGSMIYGLDVTVLAWSTVGKNKWLKVLRWPIIKWFSDKAYLFFAKHRMKISGLLMPNKCNNNGCDL